MIRAKNAWTDEDTMTAVLRQDPEYLRLATALRRAREETAEFGAKLRTMPKYVAPPAGNSAHMKHFDKFDVDASGCIGYQEALLGLRASGLDVDLEQVVEIFERCDTNKDGRISMQEFPLLAEHAAALQTGHVASAAWSHDMERLANAARVLHEQALSEPLNLVAAGEVPTLLRCAASGHSGVELLGLSALAAVAESPHAQCALAISARPALADVLSALARPSIPLPSVRQGARFLATMCQEAHDAKGLSIRRKIRLRLYEEASPLLYGDFGRRAAADEQAARDIALALAAFASEPELALRLGVDGGGGALRLACELVRSMCSGARAAAVEAICEAAAAGGANVWKLVGFGAVEPLVVMAASSRSGLAMHHEHDGGRINEAARRALSLLQYDELWRGVCGADPLADHADEQ